MDDTKGSQKQSEVALAAAMESIRKQLRESVLKQLAEELFEDGEWPPSDDALGPATSSPGQTKQARSDKGSVVATQSDPPRSG